MQKKSQKEYYVEQQLVTALLDLLNHQPISEISVRLLCKQAGVSRASYYRHFQSKEEILERHAQALIQEWTVQVEADPACKPWNVFESFFAHLKKHQHFYEVLHRTGRDTVLRTAIRQKIGWNSQLANEDAYRKAFFADGISGWVAEWIERGMQESPTELNDLLNRYFTEVLANLDQLFSAQEKTRP